MNEQNKHAALTIAQQYPPAQYNLLVPMQTVTEIADIQKPVMNSVKISTDLNDGEIYEMEKAKDEWRDSKGYVHKATPAKYALTKKGLTKLMRAAGIKILSSRPVVPSTCQKCAEVNRSIGKPIRCGGCPNKDVKHEVRISVPQLTGENVTIVAHKEIAVDDVTAGMTEKQRAEFMKFRSEIKFNTLCFPVADATLQTAAITKIKYMRESMGKGVNVVLPDAKSPDHEGVINVTNSVVVDGVELTHAEACAFVAGITASASCIKSNTYEVYNGATGIVDPKDNEAAIAAIKNGEMFFSYSEAGNVIIEYDINSLVSFKKPKDKTYSKNRVIRTLDAIQEAIQNNFPPNKYDNSPTGYAAMKGIGQSILKQYEDMGAIKNVDYDADFKIDESLSSGDEVYFIVAIQPVDSAEKLFFTVKTR